MAANSKSLENLNSWQPGESGNPGGRPSKRSITDPYLQWVEDPLPESIRQKLNEMLGEEVLPPGSTWARANALRMFIEAITEGGTRAAREIANRIEGRPPQRIEIAGREGKEVTLEVVFRKRANTSSSE